MKITKKRVLAAIMAIVLVGTTPMAVIAEGNIKSQGRFIFKNGEAALYSSDLRYLNDKVEEQITAIAEGKSNLKTAIEAKGVSVTSESAVPTFAELISGVKCIGTLGDASVGDVLSGKMFYTSEGYQYGEMPNWTGETFDLDKTNIEVNNQIVSIAIPKEGFYNTASRLVFNASDIFNSFIKLNGNVTPNQVLAGKTYYSTSSSLETGTMTDYTGKTQNANLTVSGTAGIVSIPQNGYYDKSSKLAVALDLSKIVNLTGTASASQVLAGQTFYSKSTTPEMGTMPNHAGKTQQATMTSNGDTGTVTIPAAGYYDTGASLSFDMAVNNKHWYDIGYSEGYLSGKEIIHGMGELVPFSGNESKSFLTISGLTPGEEYTVILSMYVSNNVKGDMLHDITFSDVSSQTPVYDSAIVTNDPNTGLENSSGQVYIVKIKPLSNTVTVSGSYPYNRDRQWIAHYTVTK